MTYTVKLYRRLHALQGRIVTALMPLDIWLGYAEAIPKNRAYTALWLGPRVFLGIMIVLTIIAILS